MIVNDQIIRWEYKAFADGWEDQAADEIVWVDVVAFDEAWRLTPQYITAGGGNGQGDRYARVGFWFAVNRHCWMMDATFDGDQVCFVDGRHRFSWLRDHGVESVPLQVAPDLGDSFRRRFQARSLTSVLRLHPSSQTRA